MNREAGSPPVAARRFRRRFQPSLRPFSLRMDPAPWIDGLALLALLILIPSHFVRRPGIPIELPPAPFSDGAPFGARVITLAQEGLVFVDEQRTPFEGLPAVFRQIAHEDPDTPILIEADPRMAHGALVQIYIRAAEAGLRRILLATQPIEEAAEP